MTARMTSLDTSIPFDIVLPSLIAANRKQVVRIAAGEIARKIGIGERILADRLIDKEKESPSAMGGGISVTHLHISGLHDSINVFIRLKTPVDMGAPDNKPVDLICLLLTPEREGSAYLRTMARLSRLLRNPQVCTMLRTAQNEKAIRSVFEQNASQPLAA